MRNRKIFFSILGGLMVLIVILNIIVFRGKNEMPLSVVFLDVGQGDAILISQGSQQILIDGGKDGKVLLEKLGKYIPFWDRKLETIIETHPDQDHVGGLIDVLKVYSVDSVIETKMQNDSQTFKKLEGLVDQLAGQHKLEKIEAKKDLTVKFFDGANLKILYPLESVTDITSGDTNLASVVAKLTVGSSKFLFTGDFPTTQDSLLLGSGADVGADFLKVAHHGSKYATSDEFLGAVKPREAIISVGKNNSYGHPNQEVLQRLIAHRIKIIRTDESGDLEYLCENVGNKCEVKTN